MNFWKDICLGAGLAASFALFPAQTAMAAPALEGAAQELPVDGSVLEPKSAGEEGLVLDSQVTHEPAPDQGADPQGTETYGSDRLPIDFEGGPGQGPFACPAPTDAWRIKQSLRLLNEVGIADLYVIKLTLQSISSNLRVDDSTLSPEQLLRDLEERMEECLSMAYANPGTAQIRANHVPGMTPAQQCRAAVQSLAVLTRIVSEGARNAVCADTFSYCSQVDGEFFSSGTCNRLNEQCGGLLACD